MKTLIFFLLAGMITLSSCDDDTSEFAPNQPNQPATVGFQVETTLAGADPNNLGYLVNVRVFGFTTNVPGATIYIRYRQVTGVNGDGSPIIAGPEEQLFRWFRTFDLVAGGSITLENVPQHADIVPVVYVEVNKDPFQ